MYTEEELLKILDKKYRLVLTEEHLTVNGVPIKLGNFRHSEVREGSKLQFKDKVRRFFKGRKTATKYYDLDRLEAYVKEENENAEKNWG